MKMSEELKARIAELEQKLCESLDAERAANVLVSKLEAQQAVLGKALEKLAKLGNGARYGNSEGNMIAIAALAAVKSVAMFNGMTEAETNTTASVAGLAARKTCAARGFMFGNDDACWFYCVGGGCGFDGDCEHQQPAGPKTASCTLTHEVRRFCHGDNDWSNWQPCTKEQAQEFSKSDCQVRLLVKPAGQEGDSNA